MWNHVKRWGGRILTVIGIGGIGSGVAGWMALLSEIQRALEKVHPAWFISLALGILLMIPWGALVWRVRRRLRLWMMTPRERKRFLVTGDMETIEEILGDVRDDRLRTTMVMNQLTTAIPDRIAAVYGSEARKAYFERLAKFSEESKGAPDWSDRTWQRARTYLNSLN